MTDTLHPVTEAEIEASEDCSAARDFAKSLKLSQEMLKRTEDPSFRMRLLFGIVLCAAMLDLREILDLAYRELDLLPEPDELRALANMNRAFAENELGRPESALQILDANFQTGLFDMVGWKVHKYSCLFFKGTSLIALKRPDEALDCLDAAHSLYPDEACACDESERGIFRRTEPTLQIERANCFLVLGRFEESYRAAETARNLGDPEIAAQALQYMAECRAWQGRTVEALRLYNDLKKELPCRGVDDDRIERGIVNCMKRLERLRTQSRPS
jgi:tetratricopeptide (TPR) repeat protein